MYFVYFLNKYVTNYTIFLILNVLNLITQDAISRLRLYEFDSELAYWAI